MRSILAFFIILLSAILLLFNSCNDHPTDRNAGIIKGAGFQEDTARLFTLLRAVAGQRKANDSVLRELDEAEAISIQRGLDSALAETYFLKGLILYDNNRYKSALEMFGRADTLAMQKEIYSVRARCLERMASIHLCTDDRSLAVRLYYESLSLSEKMGDSTGIARVYNILGLYKAENGQYDTAVQYMQTAIGINSRLHDRRNMIENEGNLGYIYESSGSFDRAAAIYHSLVAELTGIKDTISLPIIFYNLASLHQKLDHNDSALVYLRRAISISERTKDTSMLTVLYGNTGEIFINLHKLDSARVYMLRSVKCSRSIDDVDTELQALGFMVKLDTISGNYKDALQWNRRIQSVQDSVYSRQMRNSTKESELRYENEKKKSLIEAQNLNIVTAAKERRLFLLILLVSGIASGLLVLVLIQQGKNHRRSKELLKKQLIVNSLEIEKFQKDEELKQLRLDKAEEDLKQRDRELVSIALGLEQKNELLDEISRKLKETVRNGKAEAGFNQMNEILSSIRLQLSEQSEADLFNQRFSNIHEGFFTNLKAAYPELTPNELKFCAYLRIQLNGNQIARILNVSSEAIRKSRYRIRKKMNLDRDESLEEQLEKF